MSGIFQFGEILPEYSVPVLNEREARAGAGILFFVSLISFTNAFITGNFGALKIVVIGFFIDFCIRVFINPKYAPSLILGRFAVRNQVPEYVGAPQKRFAWALGLLLATVMLYTIVILNVRGPINMLICVACQILLFFETAFGICLGCKIYNMIYKEKAQLCPGGACEVHIKHDIQKIGMAQTAVLASFVVVLVGAANMLRSTPPVSLANSAPLSDSTAETERCKVPAFAKAIGHEDKWKQHNNCL